MRDIRNILNIIENSNKDVKPHLPESNPGETSDFVKNNARFAAHAEETLGSMVDKFEVETLPEFLRDEGVEVPNKEEDLNEYRWQPSSDGGTRKEVAKVYQCNDCDGDGTVVDETEDDAEVVTCRQCLGTGHVDAEGNPVRIGFGPREDEVVTGHEEELETDDAMFEELGKDG